MNGNYTLWRNIAIDINIGDIFGKWTILKEDQEKIGYKSRGKRYICKCECGTERSVKKSSLISGKSLSCGCAYNPPKDLTGQRFGKLLVVESIPNYEGSGKSAYRCLCDCGNEIIVKGSSIYRTKSCGCIRYDKALSNIGNKYGLLTIDNIKFIEGSTYAECTCDCGNTTTVRLDQLKSGNTTSCGCVKTPDLTGKRFNRLLVIKGVESDTKQRKWLCKCDCGCETILTTNLLTSGHTQSCGCLRSEKLSTWEIYIADILSSLNIEYKKEKIYPDCRNVLPLRFDFYIPSLNLCIEYDGEQHSKIVEYWGGENALNKRIENDGIKSKYCLDNNIQLLRITTKSKDEIREIIINAIQNPVTTKAV